MFFFAAFLSASSALAQRPVLPAPVSPAPATDSATVQIIQARTLEIVSKDKEMVRKLKGEVRLRQKEALLFCDSAVLDNNNNVVARGKVVVIQGDSLTIFADSLIFTGATRIADLFGDVVLKNGEKKLYTNRLIYNLNTKIATYDHSATLTNDQTQLTSKRGQYYVKTSEAFFKDQVVVVNKDFSLKTDTMKFDTKTNIATFLAPTLIVQENGSHIYTESGFYDTQKNNAQFTKNPQYVKGEQLATSDTMFYDGLTRVITLQGHARSEEGAKKANANTIRYNRDNEDSYLEGAAHYEDSTQNIVSDTLRYNPKSKTYATRGHSHIVNPPQILEADAVDYGSGDSTGYAIGHVYWQDTSAHISIRCDRADYIKAKDYIKAYGGRPLTTTLVNGDSLWMRADTVVSLRDSLTSVKDTNRTLLAYRNVRMFKKNFQALCDSLTYSQRDSLFRLFKNPIAWSDTSQFSADTMRMLVKDKKLDRIYLHRQSFVINSKDEVYFNQIKGKDITVFFEQDELRRVYVEGNAESLYYTLDEKNLYVGVNKTECSEMLLYFVKNKVDNIKFFREPKALMTPMKRADHEKLKIKGFHWVEDLRPKSKTDL